jgi:hypothetical protein
MISDFDICSNDLNAEILNETFSNPGAVEYSYMPTYPGSSTCQDSSDVFANSVEPTAYLYGSLTIQPTALMSHGSLTPPPEDVVTVQMGPTFINPENHFPGLSSTTTTFRSAI